jgi:hypothetical protein
LRLGTLLSTCAARLWRLVKLLSTHSGRLPRGSPRLSRRSGRLPWGGKSTRTSQKSTRRRSARLWRTYGHPRRVFRRSRGSFPGVKPGVDEILHRHRVGQRPLPWSRKRGGAAGLRDGRARSARHSVRGSGVPGRARPCPGDESKSAPPARRGYRSAQGAEWFAVCSTGAWPTKTGRIGGRPP